MSLCAACGAVLPGDDDLCAHHVLERLDQGPSNRVMCDLLHRGVVPRRLTREERDEQEAEEMTPVG